MHYVTSVERICIESRGPARRPARGPARGRGDRAYAALERRFGELPDWARDRVRSADCAMLETWSVRLLEAASVEEVLR